MLTMKVQLKKKALVNLSQDKKKLAQELTPKVAGGVPESILCETVACTQDDQYGRNMCL